MSRFSVTGVARPSRPASVLAAAVGLGMVACVLLFFVDPVLAGGAFAVLWIGTAIAVVGFHVWNAASRRGVPHTRFGFEGKVVDDPRDGHAARLRELEKLRDDGLVSDAEYREKRADILAEDW